MNASLLTYSVAMNHRSYGIGMNHQNILLHYSGRCLSSSELFAGKVVVDTTRWPED